ncbi:unnamed protein product, partial [Prorocentrum cordatum]
MAAQHGAMDPSAYAMAYAAQNGVSSAGLLQDLAAERAKPSIVDEEDGDDESVEDDECGELLTTCIARWAGGEAAAQEPQASSRYSGRLAATSRRARYRASMAPLRAIIDELLEEVTSETSRDMARDIFVKVRPDAAKSWDMLSERIAGAPPAEAVLRKDGDSGAPTVVEVATLAGNDDMQLDETAQPNGSAAQRAPASPRPLPPVPEVVAKERAAAAAAPPPQKAEPEAVEFEEIVNSMPVQPFWKMPPQKSDIPVGVRLRVFDNGGAKEVASMAVTQTVIFGQDVERAHVVDRRGVGVHPEHLALLHTPKGFFLQPISGQSTLSSVVHHRPLLVKLRGETSKMQADRSEKVKALLDQMEKQPANAVLFQAGDGRKKLTGQSCAFSLGRSERI